jgi:hypothetical protein
MTTEVETEISDPSVQLSLEYEKLERLKEQPLSLISEAFEQTEHTCTCIDEAVPGEFRLAGAGILDPEGFDHVVATMRAAGVDKVTSHTDCGAVAIAAKKELGPNATLEAIEKFGQQWAKKVADALGVPFEHRTVERPIGLHDASVVYVDFEGGLRPDRMPNDMPKGFSVSAFPTKPAHVAQQVRLAIEIMRGETGLYRQQFSEDRPITVVLVGNELIKRHSVIVEQIEQSIQDLGAKTRIEHLEVRHTSA